MNSLQSEKCLKILSEYFLWSCGELNQALHSWVYFLLWSGVQVSFHKCGWALWLFWITEWAKSDAMLEGPVVSTSCLWMHWLLNASPMAPCWDHLERRGPYLPPLCTQRPNISDTTVNSSDKSPDGHHWVTLSILSWTKESPSEVPPKFSTHKTWSLSKWWLF